MEDELSGKNTCAILILLEGVIVLASLGTEYAISRA